MEEQKRNPAASLSESEQVQVRRQKLADLQAAGNDPHPDQVPAGRVFRRPEGRI